MNETKSVDIFVTGLLMSIKSLIVITILKSIVISAKSCRNVMPNLFRHLFVYETLKQVHGDEPSV